jgi:hypothetical protein
VVAAPGQLRGRRRPYPTRSLLQRKPDDVNFLTVSQQKRKVVWGRSQLGGVRYDMHGWLFRWLEACRSLSGATTAVWSRGAGAGA